MDASMQTAAMWSKPHAFEREFGKSVLLWGGGVDTQKTLPFGTPQEVYREVRELVWLSPNQLSSVLEELPQPVTVVAAQR